MTLKTKKALYKFMNIDIVMVHCAFWPIYNTKNTSNIFSLQNVVFSVRYCIQ